MAAHRLLHPWDSPGKNTGVGCHFLLQCMKVKSESEVTQLCLTLSNPMDCSLPGSSVHGILQARIPERVTISFSTSMSRRSQSCHCSGKSRCHTPYALQWLALKRKKRGCSGDSQDQRNGKKKKKIPCTGRWGQVRDGCGSSSPDQNVASEDDDGSLYKKRRLRDTTFHFSLPHQSM